MFGILDRDDRTVIGGTGLHTQVGPDAFEIGYWIAHDRIDRGLATEVGSALTDAAFATPGVTSVVIRHDRANVRSAAVPRKLGYTMEREEPDGVTAPGEEGVSWWWRITLDGWRSRHQ